MAARWARAAVVCGAVVRALCVHAWVPARCNTGACWCGHAAEASVQQGAVWRGGGHWVRGVGAALASARGYVIVPLKCLACLLSSPRSTCATPS